MNNHELIYTTAGQLTENPLESLRFSYVFDSKDFSLDSRDAWRYGVIAGWDDESYADLKKKFNWADKEIERNKRLHEKYKEAWKYLQNL